MTATMATMPVTVPRLKEYFCQECGRFVFRSTSPVGKSKIKCESCGTWTWYNHEQDYAEATAHRKRRAS